MKYRALHLCTDSVDFQSFHDDKIRKKLRMPIKFRNSIFIPYRLATKRDIRKYFNSNYYSRPLHKSWPGFLLFTLIFLCCQNPNPVPTALQVGQIKLNAKELGRYLKKFQRKQQRYGWIWSCD